MKITKKNKSELRVKTKWFFSVDTNYHSLLRNLWLACNIKFNYFVINSGLINIPYITLNVSHILANKVNSKIINALVRKFSETLLIRNIHYFPFIFGIFLLLHVLARLPQIHNGKQCISQPQHHTYTNVHFCVSQIHKSPLLHVPYFIYLIKYFTWRSRNLFINFCLLFLNSSKHLFLKTFLHVGLSFIMGKVCLGELGAESGPFGLNKNCLKLR